MRMGALPHSASAFRICIHMLGAQLYAAFELCICIHFLVLFRTLPCSASAFRCDFRIRVLHLRSGLGLGLGLGSGLGGQGLGEIQISCPRRGYFFYLFLTHFSRGWAIFREISSLTNLL